MSSILRGHDVSYAGKARFEEALARLFQMMGFRAQRDGASGKKDILVVAPIGMRQFTFTVEGKGSKHALHNDDAEISGASAHASEAGASFAVVVAREFVGFKGKGAGGNSAVLNECRTQTPPVSIVTVETLVKLLEAVQANHYPLASLVPILREIESPDDKLARVESFVDPLEKFDFRELLECVWELQQGSAAAAAVAILQVQQTRDEWKAMQTDDFLRIILAVESLSGGLFVVLQHMFAVNLLQSPEIVAEFVATRIRAFE